MRVFLLILFAATCGWSAVTDNGLGPAPASSTVFPGGIPPSGQVAVSNGAGLVGDAGLTYDTSADQVIISHNAVALPGGLPADEVMLNVGGKDANVASIAIEGFGGTPTLRGRRCNGTNALPTAIVAGSTLLGMSGRGYGATGYISAAQAAILLQGNETWDDTHGSTKLVVQLTPLGGSITPATALTLTSVAFTLPATVIPTFGSLTSGRMTFAGTSGALGDDAALTFDSTNKTIIVNKNAVTLPAPQTPGDTLIHVGNVDGQSSRLMMEAFGSGFSPVLTGRFARNTAASPQAVQANDTLLSINGIGYGATIYGTASNAAFNLQSNETWTDSTHATKATLELTASGSVTRATVWTFTPSNTTVLNTDAGTNSISNVLTLNHATTATPAVGFGSSIVLNGFDDGAATQRLMGSISTSWTDAASATRTSKLTFNTVNNATTLNSLILTNATATFLSSDAVTSSATVVANFSHQTSGTAAANFGTNIQLSGVDDGGTQRSIGIISSIWSSAVSASRSSIMRFQVAVSAVMTNALILNATSAQFSAGFPLSISDTTASTTTAGALLIGTGTAATTVTFGAGNGNVGGSLTTGGQITSNNAGAAAASPAFVSSGTSTIGGGVTDGFTASYRLTPVYNGAFTVTRHNYIDVNNTTGTSTVTDGAVFRFNAVVGTHCALASDGAVVTTFTGVGPTGAQTTIQGWMKINVNGTMRYIPFWDEAVYSPTWCDDMRDYCNGHARSVTLTEYEEAASVLEFK